uniref:Coiled-coil domain containing 122 n=1 Tax=Xiphophorus couchianus TaxID=32473 RepID=A0A3B5N181_9TELE
KAVEDVSQHSHTQTETLREKQKTLKSLQVQLHHLSDETSLTGDFWTGMNTFASHCISVVSVISCCYDSENVKLNVLLQDEEESARSALEKFSAYRNKMQGHKDAVLQAVSQTEAHRELKENRMLVLKLRQEKEQLKEDLQNPNGITLQTAKVQNIHKTILKREISEWKTAIAEGREQLKKEFEIHAKLKRDIEIQTRRYEAIAKRLRCQLIIYFLFTRNKTSKIIKPSRFFRQTLDEIFHLQKQLTEFKGQQHSSQG